MAKKLQWIVWYDAALGPFNDEFVRKVGFWRTRFLDKEEAKNMLEIFADAICIEKVRGWRKRRIWKDYKHQDSYQDRLPEMKRLEEEKSNV